MRSVFIANLLLAGVTVIGVVLGSGLLVVHPSASGSTGPPPAATLSPIATQIYLPSYSPFSPAVASAASNAASHNIIPAFLITLGVNVTTMSILLFVVPLVVVGNRRLRMRKEQPKVEVPSSKAWATYAGILAFAYGRFIPLVGAIIIVVPWSLPVGMMETSAYYIATAFALTWLIAKRPRTSTEMVAQSRAYLASRWPRIVWAACFAILAVSAYVEVALISGAT